MKKDTDIVAEAMTYDDDGKAFGVALRNLGHGVQPYVTHMFNTYSDGRDYFWGHYFDNLTDARTDFRERVATL